MPYLLTRCAAPGGKTTMLAQLMEDKGTIIALDRSHLKAAQIMSLAKELGLTIIQAHKMDSTKAVLQPGSPQQQQQQQQQSDIVPCEEQQQRLAASMAAGAEKIRKRAVRKHATRVLLGIEQPDSQPPPCFPQQQPLPQEGGAQCEAPNQQGEGHPGPSGFLPESFDAVLLGEEGCVWLSKCDHGYG